MENLSNMIFNIKEKLTDSEFKGIMEELQKIHNKGQKNVLQITDFELLMGEFINMVCMAQHNSEIGFVQQGSEVINRVVDGKQCGKWIYRRRTNGCDYIIEANYTEGKLDGLYSETAGDHEMYITKYDNGKRNELIVLVKNNVVTQFTKPYVDDSDSDEE